MMLVRALLLYLGYASLPSLQVWVAHLRSRDPSRHVSIWNDILWMAMAYCLSCPELA